MSAAPSSITSPATVWLTLTEAAQLAHVHKNTIRRAVRHGRVQAFRLNNRRLFRFRKSDLDAWLSASPVAPTVQS